MNDSYCFQNVLCVFFFIIIIERKFITKTTSANTKDDYSSTLTTRKEISETRDEFSTTTFWSKKRTDPVLSSKSDISIDPTFTAMIKTSSSKSNDGHYSILISTKEPSEAGDEFSSSDPTLSSKSDITIDPVLTTMSDHNPQSKEPNFFWIFILIPSICLILILMAVIAWIFIKCIIKGTCSRESQVNNSSNEDIEMTSIFNEHFQETSFDGAR